MKKYYQQLPFMKMQKLNNISVKSATGSNLTPLGMIHCSFKLGNIKFHSKLIVCKNLTPTSYISVLDYQQQELVASIEIEDKPQVNMAHSVTIPRRTLAIACVYNNLDPHQSGSLYEIEPNNALMDKYPNMCIIPMIHNVDVPRMEHLPLIIINFATDDIFLSKGETMGFMQI